VSNSRAYELERRRDALLRTRQLWAAGLVIWAVVLGWVIWGFINSLTDAADMRFVWALVWLLPVLILTTGLTVNHRRLRRCEADLARNG
jgi:membrane protein DedA with SNARE-associated domain